MDSMTIQMWNGKTFDVLDLVGINTAADMLHVLLRVNRHAWGSGTALKDLIAAFDDACLQVFGADSQAIFCASPDVKVQWPA